MQIVRDCETLDIGGKAANLCRLKEFCNIPPFFVVRFDAPYEIDDSANRKRIVTECERQGFGVMAVRSSASCEDSDEASFAGIFETRLGVTAPDVLDAVRAVLGAARAPRVAEYAEAVGLTPSSIQMAVVIQQLVRSRVSGVCLTRAPTFDTITIEACYGLGELLVGGRLSPDRLVLDRRSQTILSNTVGYQKQQLMLEGGAHLELKSIPFHQRSTSKLAVEEAVHIGYHCLEIESALDFKAADIEWALDSSSLHILQARPYVWHKGIIGTQTKGG